MVIEDGDWLSGTRHGYVANFCCVLFSTADPPCAVAEYRRYRMAAVVLARPLADYQHQPASNVPVLTDAVRF